MKTTMSEACPDDNELALFVERQLSEPRRAELEDHLVGCEPCSDTVNYLVGAFASEASTPRHTIGRHALPRTGDRLGRYVILDAVGAGAMGAVYSAFDPELDRKVALKVLPPQRREGGEQLRARFLTEARAMANLSHRNVISVYDVGQEGEFAFFTMELIDGQTLTQWSSAAHSVAEVIEVFAAAGRGLAAAHSSGLVHRDFKPDNALIGNDGGVHVIDFGLARFTTPSMDTPSGEDEPADPDTDLRTSTRTGSLLGTPAYMAPEQLAGEPSGAPADQFAFCVSLFEALHGHRPFSGGNVGALSEAIDSGPSSDSSRAVPRRVRRVLTRGLSVQPSDRYPSMDALVAALTARTFSRWAPTMLVALATGGLALTANYALTDHRGVNCERDAAHLAQAWGPARRTALLEALAAHRTPASSGPTSEWLVERFDAYAEIWSSAQLDVCVASLERHEQSSAMMDRQMICLDQARTHLRTTVDLLIERGGADLDAPALVDGLPSIEACRDVATLEVGPPAPPTGLAEDIKAQRESLASARALYLAGDFSASLSLAQSVADSARNLPYAPLQYEAGLAVGVASYRLADFATAERQLALVLDEALAAQDRSVAARAAATLSCLAATELDKADAGLAYARTSLGLARTMRGQEGLRAHALRCSARSLDGAGRLEESEQRLREAVDVLEVMGDAHSHELSRTLGELGQNLKGQRRYKEAGVQLRRARDLASTIFGPDHIATAEMSAELASALVAQGQFPAAEAEFTRVVEVWTKLGKPRAPNVGLAHGKLGNLYYGQDRYEEAESEFQLALEIVEESLGTEHSAVMQLQASLANVHGARNDHGKAVEVYREVLERFEPRASPRHPVAVQLRTSAGNSLMVQERFEEALRMVEPSVPACADESNVPRGLCGDLELIRARCRLELAEVTMAATHLSAARAFYEASEQTPEIRELLESLEKDIADAQK